jgi:metallo-beta-lactamase family protein
MATLTFHGGARSVTGANYLIETENSKILVDCGLAQGTRHAEKQNYKKFSYDPSTIDAVLITHAHIDHTGRLPKLVKDGFRGKIFMTRPTKDFAEIMLDDSQGIMAYEAKREGREALYSKKDVVKTLEYIEEIEYGKVLKAAGDIKCRFRDAGHILGSAIIEVWADGQKIVFSGDLGNPPVPLLRPTEFITEADYVVVESTYGDREHEKLDERKNLLEDAIEDTVARGGTLMIPSFALERTQELLYELNSLVENHRVPEVPVFIDSPLAIDATKIYGKYPEYYNKKAMYLIESGDQVFQFPRLKFTYTAQESKGISDVPSPKIIIAGSGMSTGGRILHHERRYLPDPNSSILFIGYQAAGTLGRRIFDGAKSVKIFGERVPVRCGVKAIGGYSAHADQKKLREWVEKIKDGGKLKKTFVVQGEEGPSLAFVQLLQDHLGIDAEAPMLGDIVKL